MNYFAVISILIDWTHTVNSNTNSPLVGSHFFICVMVNLGTNRYVVIVALINRKLSLSCLYISYHC